MENLRRQFTSILELIRVEQRPQADFALILNAPPEIAHAIDDVRMRYDPAFKEGIPPHITIKRPAPLGGKDKIELIRQHLRGVITELPPVHVVLEGYGTFRVPGKNVVFLKVKDELPFCHLHNLVIEALSKIYPGGQADHFEGAGFHPHLTIGNELSEIDLAVLEHELATGGYRLDFSFTLNEIALFVHQPGQPWKTIEVFAFGKGQAESFLTGFTQE